MSNYSYNNNNDSASKLLESVLEDMNNIMKDHETSTETNSYNYSEFVNGNNNCLEVSPDKKFEFMLEELQNCLKETVDTRSVMRNISSDKREFVKSLIRYDVDATNNNISANHQVELMNEISKLKLEIAYLQRDKQSFVNQVSDLNDRIYQLEHENSRLKQEVNMMKVEEIDYCIPPTDDLDLHSVDESFQSKDSPISAAMQAEIPIATSTPDKSKINNKIPIVPPHANQRPDLPHDFIEKISPGFSINEYSGKACSWSELRTNQIIHNDMNTMTPPSMRKTSINSADRSRSFGKGDSKTNGYDIRKKMKTLVNKSPVTTGYNNQSDMQFDKKSISSQPVGVTNGNNHYQHQNDAIMSKPSSANPSNNSSNKNNPVSHFTRNHQLRMTAGPRLLAAGTALQPSSSMTKSDYNFKKQPMEAAVQRVLSHSNPNLQMITMLPSTSDLRMWTRDHICGLLHQIGLGAYANNCRRWLSNGQQLIDAPKKEIEKELNISNRLHLKKLLIHVRQLTSTHVAAAAYFSLARPNLVITPSFNTRLWLDDIGLLHYTSTFSSNCVDGYMLDQLTLEDIQQMKIYNELHIMSIKRGVQLLRAIDYDLSRLIRRPTENTFVTSNCTTTTDEEDDDEECDNTVVCNVQPGEVCRWTQHQVMEWLRRIELPEYASNIRGSGIHGALLILEDRFTAASLASVLNIPQSKSLLRRHLQAKFHELIGPEIYAKKKSVSESPECSPLNITSKMKFPRRKTFFGVIKRKPSHDCSEEILVPYTMKIDDIDLMLNSDDSSPCIETVNEQIEEDSNSKTYLPNTS